ncbi:MAG: hypothetical protein M3380_08835 [Chloroflexota bacterium]|nr:hypothetical protein [Chloroflexota bacterium]
MPNGGGQQLDAQVDLGAKLLVQRQKVWVLQQDGVDFLMQFRPFLLGPGDGLLREVLVHECFPLRDLLIASVQAQVQGKAHRATHIEAGDWIVGERIGGVAVVVMPIDVRKQAADMLAQGVIEDQGGFRFGATVRLGLLQQVANAAVVDVRLVPRRIRQEACEVGFIGACQDAAGDIRQALVGQDHQPGEVMLEMLKLAAVLKQVPEGSRVCGYRRCRGDKRQLHQRFTHIMSNARWTQ